MKILYIIMDGLGDRPIEALNGKTPLEAAYTPCMDTLAHKGMTGLMDLFSPGIPVGTDVGHICIFGYHPEDVYSGRGPIEAVGAGVRLSEGDIAFRGNFATLNNEGLLIDKRAGRIKEGTADLAFAISNIIIDENIIVRAKEATEHRIVIVFSGLEGIAPISDAYPSPHTDLPCKFPWSKALDSSLSSIKFAKIVNEYIHKATIILQKHPINKTRREEGQKLANTILLRGAGINKPLPSFTERFKGVRAGIVVAEETVRGIGLMAGMTVAMASGMTGGFDTDYGVKAKEALRLLREHNLVFIHIKGTDIAGHDNLPQKKKYIIECVDSMILSIIKSFSEPLIVAIGSDHSTPCNLGEHSGDSVPILLSGLGLRSDSTSVYNELAAMDGGLGHVSGKDFLHIVLNAGNYMSKIGV